MTAQPIDYDGPGPSERPRTPGAIKRALGEQQRAAFQAAMDGCAPEDLFALVRLWGAVAEAANDPQADAAAEAVRAGAARTHEIGDVFPALAGML
jgi:hypothetical protein